MKNYRKYPKILSAILAFVMVLGLVLTPLQVHAAADVDDYVEDLIAYYKNYQESAATDIQRTLEEMAAVDAEMAEAWTQIMDYWSYVNTDMVVNTGVAPDGLADDDSLCIVILGFALNSDGTMKDELIGRLQVGLASAEKYPNAFVVVTGGGTAANNPDVTEGGLMGQRLLDNGLAEDRLIIENQAPNTVGNAENTYKILSEQYPQVDSLVMVTSDYHVPRGCILFYSKCLLAAYESGGKALQMVSNAGYVTGSSGYESISLQASGVASVAGVSSSGTVELSRLSALRVVQNTPWQVGNELDLTITAGYHNGYTRDVTDLATVGEVDADNQTVTVSYTENGITLEGAVSLADTDTTILSTQHLEDLIAEAEAIGSAGYTKDSYAALQTAIAEARALLERTDLTVAEVDAAYNDLQAAMDGLKSLVNIAYKMNVTANCNLTNAYKVTDGTISTSNYWASQNGSANVASADAELIIDLDGTYDLEAIRVYPYWGGQRIYQYELFGSTDGETWVKIGENVSEDYATSDGFTHAVEARAAYVKLKGISTTVVGRPDINNIHIIEMQVFGTEADNIALYKPVTSSGSDGSAASSAGGYDYRIVDGDRTSYWDAGLYANEPWAIIDLQGVYKLDEINVITYWMRTDNRYYHYDLYTSVDGETYTKVAYKDSTDPETVFGVDFDLTESEIYASHIKIVGLYDSANTSFHVNELRAYGTLVDYDLILAKQALQEALDHMPELDESAYTEDSWAALEGAVAAAEEALENGENAGAVNAARENLEAALAALEEKILYAAQNTATGTGYLTVTEALTAAQEGQTVIVLRDCAAGDVLVIPGVTLDLNGHVLTADYAVGFDTAHIIDSVGSGRLVIGISNLVLDKENAMAPVYDGTAYIFAGIGFAIRQNTDYTGEGLRINAMAYPAQMGVVELLKNGGADNNIRIVIRLSWDTADGTATQEFAFNDQVVAQVYNSNGGAINDYGKMFAMTITGYEDLRNLGANIMVVSGTNAVRINATSLNIT